MKPAVKSHVESETLYMRTMLCAQLIPDKSTAEMHFFFTAEALSLTWHYAQWYSAQGVSRVPHLYEGKAMHSTSRSHAPFGVTLPCPGKCWACKTEMSIIQHEHEDVWSDKGGGQGPTKPRADRGYHFDVSVWACRFAQGALGNLQEPPPRYIHLSTFFSPIFSPSAQIPYAPFKPCNIFLSDTAMFLLWTDVNKATCRWTLHKYNRC